MTTAITDQYAEIARRLNQLEGKTLNTGFSGEASEDRAGDLEFVVKSAVQENVFRQSNAGQAAGHRNSEPGNTGHSHQLTTARCALCMNLGWVQRAGANGQAYSDICPQCSNPERRPPPQQLTAASQSPPGRALKKLVNCEVCHGLGWIAGEIRPECCPYCNPRPQP